MSTLENLTESFDRINFDTSPHQAWLSGHHQRTSNRNLRIMPSDDEDDDDEDEAIYSSEDSDQQSIHKALKTKKYTKQKIVVTKPKSTIPLPSDEEDNTDEEDDEDDEDDDELLPIHQTMKRPMHGGLPYRINRSAPTLPQQFEQHPSQQLFMQHSDGSTNSNHSSSVATNTQNQRSVSTDDLARFLKDGHDNKGSGGDEDDEDNEVIGQHLRHASNSLDVPPTIHHMHQYQQYHQQQQLAQFQYLQQQQQYVANTSMQSRNQKQQQPLQQSQQQQQQQQRMTTMSGMDLLIQREQEKAEAKRQKPKMNPGKVKIEGLLGKLPEPGTHNINFQQIQQLQQQQLQQQQQQMHHQQYMNSPVPTINSAKKHNGANRQVYYQQQQQQPYGYVPNPPSMYDYYSNGRSSVPPMNHNMYSAQQSFYQLPNYMSSGNLYTTMMAQPASQSLPQMNRPGSAMSSFPNNNNQKQQPRSTTPVSFSPQQYQQQ
ncbi:hypothetical protein PS15m_001363 [Mucor circinelloides]